MAQPIRIAYIRTTSHPNKDSQQIFALLNGYIRQPSFSEQENGKPRHRFLFGAANASDAHILELMIQRISARIQSDIDTPSDECLPGKYSHMMDRNMCRADLELHISETQASTFVGEKILKRCKGEGISTRVSAITNARCDEVMLRESNYLIDFLTPDLHYDHEAWLRNYARPGHAQQNMLTNPNYDVGKHDASRWRLSRRYMGYGWRASSGGFHGNGEWRCNTCSGTDGRCTRKNCVYGLSKERKEEFERSAKGQAKWVDENVKLPGKDDKRWMDMTAEEVSRRYMIRGFADGKEDERWKSVDTFSGE
jgi:hypothetical protein